MPVVTLAFGDKAVRVTPSRVAASVTLKSPSSREALRRAHAIAALQSWLYTQNQVMNLDDLLRINHFLTQRLANASITCLCVDMTRLAALSTTREPSFVESAIATGR